MNQDDNLLVIGIFPWNYSQLSDTVRSMIKASNHKNIIYINPQAEERSLTIQWEVRKEGNITIWNPPYNFLPTRYGIHRLREKLSAHSLSGHITKELGKDWRDHTVMYVTPTTLELSFEFVKTLQPSKLILDILDDNLNFPSISDKKKEKLTNMFKYLCKQSTTITAVSEYLVEQTKSLSQKAKVNYLPNGVDVEMFQKKEETSPRDLANIPHPRITFVGALTTWIDLPLIIGLADKWKDYQFILIGPVDQDLDNHPETQRLKQMENVHFLGSKPYKEVPNYLHYSDVLLLPRTMDPYSLACDPLKLYEYLATGKPVVSTNHPSIKRFPKFVQSGGNVEELADGISKSLNRSREVNAAQQEVVHSLSWETRINKLLKLAEN